MVTAVVVVMAAVVLLDDERGSRRWAVETNDEYVT